MERSNSNFRIENVIETPLENLIKGTGLTVDEFLSQVPKVSLSKDFEEKYMFKIDTTGLSPEDIRHPSREEIEWMASVEGFNPDKMIEVEITHHIANAIEHDDYSAYDKEELKVIKKWLKSHIFHSYVTCVDDFIEVEPYESVCHVTGKKDLVVPVLVIKK
jgi:hypothetical protein